MKRYYNKSSIAYLKEGENKNGQNQSQEDKRKANSGRKKKSGIKQKYICKCRHVQNDVLKENEDKERQIKSGET
jgi:hypothetical protein